MQRQLLGAGLFALAALAAGCNRDYVAGRCDCQYRPENAAIAPATNPYPVIGANNAATPTTTAPGTTPPSAMPTTIPSTTTGK